MANLGILEKERKLRKDLIELENQLQAAETKGDKARQKALEKQIASKDREVELHKVNTVEAKESLNIGKQIVSNGRKWNNTLKGTSGIVMGVQNLMADIDILGSKLTDWDFYYIPFCIRIITFELGLRFLNEYLGGDLNFRANYPTHNLFRAEVQFLLLESIESQMNKIVDIVNQAKVNYKLSCL